MRTDINSDESFSRNVARHHFSVHLCAQIESAEAFQIFSRVGGSRKTRHLKPETHDRCEGDMLERGFHALVAHERGNHQKFS
jgi:hypothetical protein